MHAEHITLQVVVGFCDPCTLESNPGWPLRNFLALIAKQWCVTFVYLYDYCIIVLL